MNLFIRHNLKWVSLNLNDVFLIKGMKDYAKIYTKDKEYMVLKTMNHIESRLPRKEFLRIHRSYIVRIDKIKEIDGYGLAVGDKFVPVSKDKYEELMKNINKL